MYSFNRNKLASNDPASNLERSLLVEDHKYWDRLLDRENRIIEQAMLPKGHLDPRKHPHHKTSLMIGEDRAFVKEFKLVPYHTLINSNVRDEEVDEKYVKEHLRYLMDSWELSHPDSCGLQYPVIGVEDPITKNIVIQSGHHRAKGCDIRDTLVPVIVITEFINQFGQKADPNSKNYAKTRCNPYSENKQMTLADGVLHLQEIFTTDPTLNGLNPSGQKPPRRAKDGKFDFDKMCEHVFGDTNFPSPQARGKLYNRWTKQGHKSKTCQTSNEDNITLFLSRNGLATGIDKKTGKRKDVVKHGDVENGAIIVQTDDNGDNFGGKLWRVLREFERNPAYAEALKAKGITKVIVAGRLYKPPPTLKEVKARRAKFYKLAEDYDKILSKCTPLRIEKVIMPKELELTRDKDEVYFIPKVMLRKCS